MKKVAVTGGSGFIGRYVIRKLGDFLPAGSVTNLDLREPDFSSHAIFIRGDIRNASDVKAALSGADTLIHLAAMHHDFGIADDAYFDTNVEGARLLIEEAEKQGITTIVNYSSVAVYGNKGNPGPTTEETVPAPTNAYGRSKLQAEELFRAWAAKDPARKLIIVRSTVVFGAYNLANVLSLIRAIDQGLYIHVGKGDNIKSLAYVENIVDATFFALEHTPQGICLFNYVDEPQLSSRRIAELQARLLGKKIRLSLPRRLMILLAGPFDLAILLSGKNLKISSKRVKKLGTQTYHSAALIRKMGFVPSHTIEYGMQQMVSWYKGIRKKNVP